MESTKIKIAFICDRLSFQYFEDYINTFHNLFDVIIYLFNKEDDIPYFLENNSIFYIFIQSIPSIILNNLDFYKQNNYKLAIFNTEQLSRKGYAYMVNNLDSYFYRVDYSEINLLVVAIELNHKKIYLPYQVHYREIRDLPKIYDVCMIYPYKSEKRRKIINDLQSYGIHVDEISGFRDLRDSKLFQYKILINIHYDDDYKIFEEMRCNRCIFNKMIVLSETSLYDDFHILKKHILVTDYNNIVDKVRDILRNYQLYYDHIYKSFDKLLPIYDNDLQEIALSNIQKAFT
jgi:hypothetical protein